jgi:AraC-like DNA-binding protein
MSCGACKLERAREALERDGVSIAEAAYLAGYSSVSNFRHRLQAAFSDVAEERACAPLEFSLELE